MQAVLQTVRRKRRDIQTSCSKLVATQTKDGDSESLPGVLNSSAATCVVTVPRDPASFVDRISSGTRRPPNQSTQPHRGDRPRLGDGRRGVEEDQTKRLQTCSGTSPPVDENPSCFLDDGLTGDQGESVGSRCRSGTDAFQGPDSSRLSRKPIKNAAETVQPAADTDTAAVKREGETLAEAANASRFDDGHGCESTCALQEHHEEGQALR